jgi:hypothetical protein
MCSDLISLIVIFPPIYHIFRHYPLEKSNYTYTHRIVIIVIIVVLTLCYSMMSHATLILYYHASMLTLQTSLVSCTIIERLECIPKSRVRDPSVPISLC